jgi:hypothetical protein
VKKGYFKNTILNLWTGLLLLGALGCLIVPFFALQYWHRWMFMLVYPFTFYAVSGLIKLSSKISQNRKTCFLGYFPNKKIAGMTLLTLSLGIAYLFTPVTMAFANKSIPNITRTQVYFSTDPGVPYQDEDSVVQAMNWFNQHLGSNSCVILQRHFLPYGQFYLNNSHAIIQYEIDLNDAVNKAIKSGFSRVFFVWWNTPVDWDDMGAVPQSFVRVQDFGRISVYGYEM